MQACWLNGGCWRLSLKARQGSSLQGRSKHNLPYGYAFSNQRGMSLVELMVGITIGLFIVAAATLLVSNQLVDNRRLLLETQLQQDMRASMDIMSRQIRRAGSRKPNGSLSLLSGANGAPGTFDTEYTEISVGAGGREITFDYFWDLLSDTYLGAGNAERNWGFKLEDGRIRARLSQGGWQDLTDRSTVTVTNLQFTEVVRASQVVPCPKLCPGGGTACWPRADVRAFRIVLQAQAASDALVSRRMEATVRLRSDLPVFNANSTTQPCPL